MSVFRFTSRPLHPSVFLGGVIGYYALISVVSHIPGDSLAQLDCRVWDKAIHFAEYMPLGLLAAIGISRQSIRLGRTTILFVGILLVFGFGILDEYHQSFVLYRFSTWSDVAADTLGGSVGAAIGSFSGLSRSSR